MKIAFIGDIVGSPARYIIKNRLHQIRDEFQLDFVFANYENASHGFGVTPKHLNELQTSGIDFFTGGNHSFDKKEIIPIIDSLPIIRPINLPTSSAGQGLKILKIKDKKVAIINLMGNFGMPMVDNPFTKILETIKTLKVDKIFIDFHGEATAEKRTLLMLLAGKVDLIYGTHTHIATDDFQLFQNTFYITDIGLTGCFDNVIGMDKKSAIQRALTGISTYNKVPEQNECLKVLQMIIIDFEQMNGFTYKIFDNGQTSIRKAFQI